MCRTLLLTLMRTDHRITPSQRQRSGTHSLLFHRSMPERSACSFGFQVYKPFFAMSGLERPHFYLEATCVASIVVLLICGLKAPSTIREARLADSEARHAPFTFVEEGCPAASLAMLAGLGLVDPSGACEVIC